MAAIAAAALAAITLTPPVAAQDASFAAGGLSNWGTSVNGANRPAPGGERSASDNTANETNGKAPAGKPAAKVRRATAPKAAAAEPDTLPQAKPLAKPSFTPAAMMPRGPIVVRPPSDRAPPAAAAAAAAATVAPPGTAPANAAPTLAAGDCLAVNQIGPGTYQIENAGCRNGAVLATIEIRNGRGSRSITCYIARIRDAYAVTSPPGTPPRINHQCRDGAPGCAESLLKTMFPECRGSV